MSLLTLIFIALIVAAVRFQNRLKELGQLGLAIGVLGQLVGLYEMFKGIESLGDGIGQAMIAGGLKNSMICLIYGVVIYVISIVFLIRGKAKS